MTLNLTPEQKKERRKEYTRQYQKAYYHEIKETEPETHQKRINRVLELALIKYKQKKIDNPEIKTVKKRKLKIKLDDIGLN